MRGSGPAAAPQMALGCCAAHSGLWGSAPLLAWGRAWQVWEVGSRWLSDSRWPPALSSGPRAGRFLDLLVEALAVTSHPPWPSSCVHSKPDVRASFSRSFLRAPRTRRSLGSRFASNIKTRWLLPPRRWSVMGRPPCLHPPTSASRSAGGHHGLALSLPHACRGPPPSLGALGLLSCISPYSSKPPPRSPSPTAVLGASMPSAPADSGSGGKVHTHTPCTDRHSRCEGTVPEPNRVKFPRLPGTGRGGQGRAAGSRPPPGGQGRVTGAGPRPGGQRRAGVGTEGWHVQGCSQEGQEAAGAAPGHSHDELGQVAPLPDVHCVHHVGESLPTLGQLLQHARLVAAPHSGTPT